MLLYLNMIEDPQQRDTFELVYRKYRYLMLHVAKGILGNYDDAEDAVHEAFLAIIKNLYHFSEIDSPKTKSLVVIVVEHKAIDMLRKRKRENLVELNEALLGIEIPAPSDNALASAMAKLPAQYRQALLMRYDNGLTVREIGKLLSISESGVRKLLSRAKQALSVQLEKEGVTL